jgi:hypothetical protein
MDQQEDEVMTRDEIPPPTEFGDVSPCLFAARKHGVDWRITLSVVDRLIHGREWPSDLPPFSAVPDAVFRDCSLIAARTNAQHRWAFYHPATFINGQWVVS